jgi:ferredoxin
MSQVISPQAIRRLVDAWLAAGKRVLGPVRVKPDLVLYQPLQNSQQLLLDGFIRPGNSIKETVFPRHETLFQYRLNGKQTELIPAELPSVEQIVLAARPCDAAALPILDHVFNWDFRDASYNRRRELTTVISLACAEHDANCFCTSVGCGPDDPRGSDAMLLAMGDGTFEVRLLTDKGKALLAGQTTASQSVGHAGPAPEKRINLDSVEQLVASSFERSEWSPWTVRCLGCGSCAFGCPTCHCFDMVDEGGPAAGARVRNWDACQFGLFTLHASGHNPRSVQPQRQRQRIYHKFHVYLQKFGEVLCTGCGNCTRNCPVSLGVLPVLEAMQAAGAKAK